MHTTRIGSDRGLKGWFLERSGLGAFLAFQQKLLGKLVPGRLSWIYTTGALALFFFGLQFITGILLLAVYVPDASQAYASVQTIEHRAELGWLVRQMHSWGASFVVLVLVLHVLKVLWYGSYKRPREFTWFVGVLLLAIALAFGFSGYLLPWNQLAFWATRVALEAVDSVPVLGKPLKVLICGGEDVSGRTIGRFFALHVMVLPLLLLGLGAWHLVLVTRKGTAPKTRVSEELREGHAAAVRRHGAETFFPRQLLRDLLACNIGFALLVTVATFFPWELGEPASLDTPEGIKPEWYFLPMYQFVKYFDDKFWALCILGGTGLVFLLLPLLDRGDERRMVRRAWMAPLGPLAVLGGLAAVVVWRAELLAAAGQLVPSGGTLVAFIAGAAVVLLGLSVSIFALGYRRPLFATLAFYALLAVVVLGGLGWLAQRQVTAFGTTWEFDTYGVPSAVQETPGGDGPEATADGSPEDAADSPAGSAADEGDAGGGDADVVDAGGGDAGGGEAGVDGKDEDAGGEDGGGTASGEARGAGEEPRDGDDAASGQETPEGADAPEATGDSAEAGGDPEDADAADAAGEEAAAGPVTFRQDGLEPGGNCIRCHYDPHDEWSGSVHATNRVQCADCHGGNDTELPEPVPAVLAPPEGEDPGEAADPCEALDELPVEQWSLWAWSHLGMFSDRDGCPRPPESEEVRGLCGECHQRVRDLYSPAHLERIPRRTCIKCHENHEVEPTGGFLYEKAYPFEDDPRRARILEIREILASVDAAVEEAEEPLESLREIAYPTGRFESELARIERSAALLHAYVHTLDPERVRQGDDAQLGSEALLAELEALGARMESELAARDDRWVFVAGVWAVALLLSLVLVRGLWGTPAPQPGEVVGTPSEPGEGSQHGPPYVAESAREDLDAGARERAAAREAEELARRGDERGALLHPLASTGQTQTSREARESEEEPSESPEAGRDEDDETIRESLDELLDEETEDVDEATEDIDDDERRPGGSGAGGGA